MITKTISNYKIITFGYNNYNRSFLIVVSVNNNKNNKIIKIIVIIKIIIIIMMIILITYLTIDFEIL